MIIGHRERLQLDNKYNALAKLPHGNKIEQALKSDPTVLNTLENHWLCKSFYCSGMQAFPYLVQWYLWMIDTLCIDKAKTHLENYLQKETVTATQATWVYGIKPNQSYSLEGYAIIPAHLMPDSWEKREFLRKQEMLESPNAAAAFVKKIGLPRVVDNSADGNKLIYGHRNQAEDVAMLVNAISELSCQTYYTTLTYEQTIPFGAFGVGGGAGPKIAVDVLGVHSRNFTDKHKDALDQLIKLNGNAPPDTKAWIQAILDRLKKSKRQQDYSAKVLDAGISLEMLLLNEKTKANVSKKFIKRGSSILASTPEERQCLEKTLKDFYSIRSTIAHEGIFKQKRHIYKNTSLDSIKKDHRDFQRVKELMPDILCIIQRLVILALSPGYPKNENDWGVIINKYNT